MMRQEQRPEDTWRLEDLYGTEEEFQADAGRLEKLMEEFAAMQGTLGQGAEQLLKVLDLYARMNQVFEKLYVYANQRYHEDTANAKYQQMSGEMQIMGTRLSQAASWLEPELLALPGEQLDAYFADALDEGSEDAPDRAGNAGCSEDAPDRAGNAGCSEDAPDRAGNAGCSENTPTGSENGGQDLLPDEAGRLRGYGRFVRQITRQRAHVLDADQEALMARISELGQGPSNIFSMFNNADIRFPKVAGEDGELRELTLGTYISCQESSDRTLRKNSFEALYSVYGQFQNTLAATYYANAKQADFFAKEHRYANAMEAALDGSAIPVPVYENLVKTVNDRLMGMHRYVKLRKRLLGLEELHMYDVYVPVVKRPEKKYSFEEAKEIVKRGMAPLGEDYQALLQEGFTHRWIDVYENQGKRTGAYSWGAYGTHPYVLLNYHGSLNDVFTLAHEMGHALHSWYSDHAQSYLDAGYKIFVAEVASTCNEALLIHDLLGRTEDETERRYLINYFLEQFKGTMFRQTMFAEFEMQSHRIVENGGTLTAETLNGMYLELNRKYFGEDMISDPQIAYEWARIPHFYTPFYVYQYATGFAAAIAISSRILAGEPGIVEKYKQFLSGGCSADPIDLLKICGVDMSTPEPVNAALDVFEQYLAEMESTMC